MTTHYIEANDIIVLKMETMLADAIKDQIRELIAAKIGHPTCKVLVLDKGVTIDILKVAAH